MYPSPREEVSWTKLCIKTNTQRCLGNKTLRILEKIKAFAISFKEGGD